MSTIRHHFRKKTDWPTPQATLPTDNNHAFSPGALVVASGSSSTASFYLSALFCSGTFAGLSDGERLERFAAWPGADEETAELALPALASRHGYVLDHRRVIRGRHVCRSEPFESAVAALLKE